MGWSLDADVEFSGETTKLIRPFIEYYGNDINVVLINVERGNYPTEKIARLEIIADIGLEERLIEEIKKYESDNIRITLQFYLKLNAFKELPVPELVIFGHKLDGYSFRRRAPIIIGFGNRNAWRGESTLSNSCRKIDESLVAGFLKHFCIKIKPKSLYLVNEEQVSIPFNDHFVYHSDISGFAKDLNDIIKLCLYGGNRYYSDGRAKYEAVLYEEKTMLLCNRRGEHREKFKEYLKARLPILEGNGLIKITKDMVEEALLKYSDIMDFFMDSDGVGIFSKPLLGKYIEMFYISLIDDLT